ncbi:glycosyltransferase family 9 protein [Campylobacter sp. FMV-PI01]|uniref:Glycosyltransferase family 9 protein n=1 Tax=Campylobacter portucalensis TaxID=2608384 RepID=A0A6L5WJA3_9BACT|nr:glycosyltransferase family 9 protein [Campylobacter portucalensis]MSN96542.1 glycosyltransferase family 9 protein [Campylobacter portucalensis]
MKLLITRHDKIGDFILTLPMIKLAKKRLPNSFVAVLVSKVNYEFAKKISFIDEVILYDENPFKLSKTLKKYKFDISISAFIDTNLGLALFLSCIKTRVAPATKIAQIFFNKRVVQRRSKGLKKEFEYNIDLLKFAFPDINTKFTAPVLEIDESFQKEIFNKFKAKFKLNDDKKIIAFHPGFGGSSDANLSFDEYLNLAKSIHKDINIVFSFGPDDEVALNYFQENLDFKAIIFKSTLSLYEFCALVSNFKLFVSTSTGPMHLAAAVNTPTMSFFNNSAFSKRWISINDKQINFYIDKDNHKFKEIKKALNEFINKGFKK